MGFFKIRITKRPVEEQPFKWRFSDTPTQRIGLPSQLVQGDVIMISGESWLITDIKRKLDVAEEVWGIRSYQNYGFGSAPELIPYGDEYLRLLSSATVQP